MTAWKSPWPPGPTASTWARAIWRRAGPGNCWGRTKSSASPPTRRKREAGADYLGCGAAFATGTKADAKPISKETIRAVTAAAGVPVVAIGGVSRENILELKGLGLAGVAVVSGIFRQPDAEAAARELLALARQL